MADYFLSRRNLESNIFSGSKFIVFHVCVWLYLFIKSTFHCHQKGIVSRVCETCLKSFVEIYRLVSGSWVHIAIGECSIFLRDVDKEKCRECSPRRSEGGRSIERLIRHDSSFSITAIWSCVTGAFMVLFNIKIGLISACLSVFVRFQTTVCVILTYLNRREVVWNYATWF